MQIKCQHGSKIKKVYFIDKSEMSQGFLNEKSLNILYRLTDFVNILYTSLLLRLDKKKEVGTEQVSFHFPQREQDYSHIFTHMNPVQV